MARKAPLFAGYRNAPPVGDSPDLQRIANLPWRTPPEQGSPEAQALIEMMTQRLLLKHQSRFCDCRSKYGRKECILELRYAQAWTLFELMVVQGAVGNIGVGWGKTGIGILAPKVVPNCHCAVVMLPPNVAQQFIDEYWLMKNHWQVPTLISHVSQAESKGEDLGPPYLHLVPYTILSHHESSDKLQKLNPDLIVADEAHNLADAGAVRTSRVLREFRNDPRKRFLCMSGSMDNTSIRNSAHLKAMALKFGSPAPLDPDTLIEWAGALDPVKMQPPTAPGKLRIFCPHVEKATTDDVLEGLQLRGAATPGVITTRESVVEHIELHIREAVVPEIPTEIRAALANLRDNKMRPDGEVLLDAFAVNRCALELSCGFFYKWVFPIGTDPLLIEEWRSARQAWFRELRYFVEARREYLDSPYLCQLAAQRAWGELESVDATDFSPRGDSIFDDEEEDEESTTMTPAGVTVHDSYMAALQNTFQNDRPKPHWKATHWPRWSKVRKLIRPISKAERMSPFLVAHVSELALREVGIVWYARRAFGVWVSELSGLPLHSGGTHAGRLINAEKGDRSIVASIKSHGIGRNGLQFKFHRQWVPNPPSDPRGWEQLLGRTVRPGQMERIVYADFFRHTREMRKCVDKALRTSSFVELYNGNKQKLISSFVTPNNSEEDFDFDF